MILPGDLGFFVHKGCLVGDSAGRQSSESGFFPDSGPGGCSKPADMFWEMVVWSFAILL